MNLTFEGRPRGIPTHSYDANTGDLETTTYSDGTTSLDYNYDRRGRVTSIVNGNRTTTLGYDDVGNVLSEAVTGGPLDGMSFTQTLDTALRRSQYQLSLGSTTTSTTYNYSSTTGRLESINGGNGS